MHRTEEDSDWDCEMFNNKDLTCENEKDTQVLEENTRVNTQSYNRHTCCVACRKMQKTLLQKMDVLINLLSSQQEKISLSASNATYETNILPHFPLSTTDELMRFNEELEKYEDLKIIFKSSISTLGGRSPEHKVRNILKHILTDELCRQMSWTGQKGSIPIKDIMTISIITDYISSSTTLDIYTIHKIIAEWLRHAGDRIRYRTKTEKKDG
ncbi:uncharacterized protein LOC109857384 isoform X2 [Pseudomyrmex gracilis]|nr:uncharacterized protein LOC109857384 isoform X2 [Pseudomyrmex gracilis]